MRLATCVLIVLFAGSVATAGEKAVELKREDSQLQITIGGEEFAVYNFGSDQIKPYFWPVRAPDGTILTRSLVDPEDHAHHTGLWLSIDKVNGHGYWHRAKIKNVSVETLPAQQGAARFKLVNHWQDDEGRPVVVENSIVSVYPNRLLTYSITFTAANSPATFGDTKEGMFAFRMVNSMRESEGGHVVNADGLEGSNACWGKTSPWVDYYGDVDGQTYGVAIFDHPGNFRPSRYHVRNYGLFAINPFGPEAYTNGEQPADPVTLQPGESLRLRYAMYFHNGDAEEGRVAETYQKFLELEK